MRGGRGIGGGGEGHEGGGGEGGGEHEIKTSQRAVGTKWGAVNVALPQGCHKEGHRPRRQMKGPHRHIKGGTGYIRRRG